MDRSMSPTPMETPPDASRNHTGWFDASIASGFIATIAMSLAMAVAFGVARAIGNPLYHWCHLELSVYFGYQGVLNGETAQEVWDLCAEKFSQPGMSVRGLIARSNVAFIGTTDDPCDSLEWHRLLADDPSMKTTVAPSFRPDAALNIATLDW